MLAPTTSPTARRSGAAWALAGAAQRGRSLAGAMRSRGSRDVPVVNELHEPPEIVKDGSASQEMESLSPRHAVSSTDSQATIDIDEEKHDNVTVAAEL